MLTFSIAAQTIAVVQPNDANYLSGTVGISWTYVDGNFVAGTHDVNIDIFYSATAGAYTTALVTDANADAYCGAEANYAVSKTCTYTFDTTAIADGNYFIDLNITTFNTATPADQNNLADSSDANFQVDNTAPTTITISGPLKQQIFPAGKDKIAFTYSSAADDILVYWVWVDSEAVINNSTNTTYTFTLGAGAHTVNVIAMDDTDNNSATASTTFTIATLAPGTGGTTCGDNSCDAGETAATCPVDCGAVCGDNACTNTENVDNCPADCGPSQVCGNNVCDSGETYSNCPADCEAPSIEPPVEPPIEPPIEPPVEPPIEPPNPVTCNQLNCDDGNICTNDSCENARCLNIPKPDGESCGTGLVCKTGQCVKQELVEIPGETGDNTILIAGIIVVVIVAGAYFFYFRK